MPRGRMALAATAALVGVLGWSSVASADFGGSMRWVSVGGNLGLSHHSNDTFGALGAEASVGGIQTFVWGGVYGDAMYDFGTKRVRFSLGPEVGLFFLGVDGGVVFDVGEGKARQGFVVRPMLAFGWAFPYVRFGRILGDDPYSFTEVGVVLKYPFTNGAS